MLVSRNFSGGCALRPQPSHAAHAEGEEEGVDRVLCTSFNPLTTHTNTYTYTHTAHPLILKITMFLCVHRILLAYNIQDPSSLEIKRIDNGGSL